jgi:phenylpyruvate tautomerase PptA (4-oxalocrotonate tautomerase family)
MTQPKINLTILKKHLKDRSKAELIADIAELYRTHLGSF